MPRYVALLRGINVGGARPLPMAKLRAITESIGATDVETYIQSGNVVLSHAATATKVRDLLVAAIAKATKYDVPVVVRTGKELTKALADNPFPEDAEHTYVCFLPAKPAPTLLATFDQKPYAPDRCALRRDLYYLLPNGGGRSQLVGKVSRIPEIAAGTVRNWRTVTKLVELAS